MARWSRTARSWLAALGTVWIPVVITVSGVTGFWPVLGVCAAGALWTCWLFRSEVANLTTAVAPNDLHQRRFWLFLPGIAVLLLAAYPFFHLYVKASAPVESLGFEDVLQSYMHDRSIYVSDLARTEIIVHDKVFERVTLVGPAVIDLLSGNSITYSNMAPPRGVPVSQAFIESSPGMVFYGVIGFRDCEFKQCTFERIQFIGTKAQMDQLKAGIRTIEGRPASPADVGLSARQAGPRPSPLR
jgi:hypothetical protein